MARLRKNSTLEALQGSLGKELVFKQYADKTVVSKYPDMSKVKTTERQALQRDKMKKAQAYWRRVKRDLALQEEIKKSLLPGENLYRKVIKEFMRGGFEV